MGTDMKFFFAFLFFALICMQSAFFMPLDLIEKSRKFTVKVRAGRPSWIPEDANITTVTLKKNKLECYVPSVGMIPPKSVVKSVDGSVSDDDPLDQAAKPIGGEEFIRQKSSECIYLHTGEWFMYELCPFNKIRQFHVENAVETVNYDLGFYDVEETKRIDFDKIYSDALSLEETDRSNLSVENKVTEGNGFSFVYSKGTVCDLNGKHRRTIVHYHCEKDISSPKVTSPIQRTPIFKIEEPQPCEYVVHLYANFMCEHPILQSRLSSESVETIECWKPKDDEKSATGDPFFDDDFTEVIMVVLDETVERMEEGETKEDNSTDGDDSEDVSVEEIHHEKDEL